MPSLPTMWPRNFIERLWNSHFLGLSVTPAAYSHSNVVFKRKSCSFWFAPNMMTSSIRQRTPGRPSSSWHILLWNNSGALEIPNGSLSPKWGYECREVSGFACYGICQYLLLASSLLNRVTPESWARVSSTLGIGWISLRTHSFKGFKSTQIRMSPDRLVTTTIPAHHWVCFTTFEITPIASSSAQTLSRRGMAMFLCV